MAGKGNCLPASLLYVLFRIPKMGGTADRVRHNFLWRELKPNLKDTTCSKRTRYANQTKREENSKKDFKKSVTLCTLKDTTCILYL